MYQSAAGSFFLVIGTGINVNQKEFPEEVKKTAGSLALELGADVDREVLLASVLRHFLDCYDSFLETMDLSGQKELYESFLVNKGRVVEVLDPKVNGRERQSALRRPASCLSGERTVPLKRSMPEKYQ